MSVCQQQQNPLSSLGMKIIMKQSFHLLLLAALILLSTAGLSAQTQVQGRVVDEQGEPLTLANILLLTAVDSVFIIQRQPESEGRQTLERGQG